MTKIVAPGGGGTKNRGIGIEARFAIGIKQDYDAVRNNFLYPHISNGPIEGTNNKCKMIRRRGYGRAGLELRNALAVLPWHYKDLHKDSITVAMARSGKQNKARV